MQFESMQLQLLLLPQARKLSLQLRRLQLLFVQRSRPQRLMQKILPHRA
jgi:hypothetical protein